MAYPSMMVLAGISLALVAFAWTGSIDVFGVMLAFWWGGLLRAVMTIIKLNARETRSGQPPDDPFDWPLPAYILVVGLLSAALVWIIGASALTIRDGLTFQPEELFGVPISDILRWIGRTTIAWPVLLYLILRSSGTIYSFVTNYLRRGEYRRTHDVLMHAIIRIVLPQIAVFLVAAGVIHFGWPVWIAAAAGGLTDILTHGLERMEWNPDSSPQKPYTP